jgi:hypothetical protein
MPQLEDDIRAALDKDLTAGDGVAGVTFRLTKIQIDAIIQAEKAVFAAVKKSPSAEIQAKAAEMVAILTAWEAS